MFHDLHVLWQGQVAETQQTLLFLQELGYKTVALTHVLSGKLPADLSCQIPEPLPFEPPSKLRVLRRCTLILSDPSQNHRLPELAAQYDILAVRPTNDKSLMQACNSLDCDIISIDLTARFDSHFKMKSLSLAIERGIKLELCYAPGLAAGESSARRNLISNATQLIRASRGRGLILSSEAHRAINCRAPTDVINLAAVWGLGPEKGKDALDKLARNTVARAQLKRTSYRGTIDIISPIAKNIISPIAKNIPKAEPSVNKRKIGPDAGDNSTPQLSKREIKRRKKATTVSNGQETAKDTNET